MREKCSVEFIKDLGEVGDFFVQVGQGGFEGFAVIGVGGGT